MSELERSVTYHIDNNLDFDKNQEQDVSLSGTEYKEEISDLNESNKRIDEINDKKIVENGEIVQTECETEMSKSNLEHEDNFQLSISNLEFPESNHSVNKLDEKIVGNVKSNIQIDSNVKCMSVENISTNVCEDVKVTTGSTDKYIYDKKIGSDSFISQDISQCIEKQRRSSLPEHSHINIGNKNDLNIEQNKNFPVESHTENENIPKLRSLQSERAKVAPNLNNLSEVVRNVHGLFSTLKNAYKPMEKNIGEIMMATQKNLTSAKNGYLHMKNDRMYGETKSIQNQKDLTDALSKYSTLNLSNENQDFENSLFSKCDKFAVAENKNNVENKKIEHSKTTDEIFVLSNDEHFDSKSLSSIDGELKKESKFDEFFNLQSETCGSNENNINCEGNNQNFKERISNGPDENGLRSGEDYDKMNTERMRKDLESLSILEATVLEQNKEMDSLRLTLFQKDALKKDLEYKISELSKQLEASVMRYAVSERASLALQKAQGSALDREMRAREEAALLERRLKGAHAERSRICDMLDEKSHEVSTSQKEIARLKEELQACDTKLKWAQNKLMSEIEARKEASSLAEKLGQQVAQQELNAGNATPSQQQSCDIEVQIKEKEASAILERHERQRIETRCKQLHSEADQLKAALNAANTLNSELRAQAESSGGEAGALRAACAELREQGARDCERLAAAQARAARLDTLVAHLHQEQEKCARLQQELEAEKNARGEAAADAELSARREAELLRQAERLTEAGVRLQATCSEAEAKALALSVDNASLRTAAAREAEKHALARAEAEKEKQGRAADAKALAAAAARHQRAERQATQRAEQLGGDLRVMATKHASAVKELKREIQQWKRKCDKLETDSQSGSHVPTKPAQRTGSCSSLSSYEGSSAQHLSQADSLEPIIDVQVDRQQLVERIVQLQRASARRGERLEFLEGHSAQLTAELQKKSRLLRALMAASPAGALAAPASDRAKAEISRHGGIMASLFNHEVSDDTMTLDLSLEINAKLQSVLEDTLLKNITLKENMDTLGDEIARLKEELSRKQKK